jgi:hypothetical protein
MSALGQKRTLRLVRLMSALPPKADIAERDHRAFSQATLDHRQLAHLRRWLTTCVVRQTKFVPLGIAGDRIGALRIAARFFDRSNETMIFRRGVDANNHPGFYRQLGKVPQELVTAALALLQKRFDLR